MENAANVLEKRRAAIERRRNMIQRVVDCKTEDPDLMNWQIAEMLQLPESTVRNVLHEYYWNKN